MVVLLNFNKLLKIKIVYFGMPSIKFLSIFKPLMAILPEVQETTRKVRVKIQFLFRFK